MLVKKYVSNEAAKNDSWLAPYVGYPVFVCECCDQFVLDDEIHDIENNWDRYFVSEPPKQ